MSAYRVWLLIPPPGTVARHRKSCLRVSFKRIVCGGLPTGLA